MMVRTHITQDVTEGNYVKYRDAAHCSLITEERPSKPGSPALQADALPSEPPGKPLSRGDLIKLTHGTCLVVQWLRHHAPKV